MKKVFKSHVPFLKQLNMLAIYKSENGVYPQDQYPYRIHYDPVYLQLKQSRQLPDEYWTFFRQGQLDAYMKYEQALCRFFEVIYQETDIIFFTVEESYAKGEDIDSPSLKPYYYRIDSLIELKHRIVNALRRKQCSYPFDYYAYEEYFIIPAYEALIIAQSKLHWMLRISEAHVQDLKMHLSDIPGILIEPNSID